jgi:hypothetical protein
MTGKRMVVMKMVRAEGAVQVAMMDLFIHQRRTTKLLL